MLSEGMPVGNWKSLRAEGSYGIKFENGIIDCNWTFESSWQLDKRAMDTWPGVVSILCSFSPICCSGRSDHF